MGGRRIKWPSRRRKIWKLELRKPRRSDWLSQFIELAHFFVTLVTFADSFVIYLLNSLISYVIVTLIFYSMINNLNICSDGGDEMDDELRKKTYGIVFTEVKTERLREHWEVNCWVVERPDIEVSKTVAVQMTLHKGALFYKLHKLVLEVLKGLFEYIACVQIFLKSSTVNCLLTRGGTKKQVRNRQ